MMSDSHALQSLINNIVALCGTTASSLSELSISEPASQASLLSTAAECLTTRNVLEQLEPILRQNSKVGSSTSAYQTELQDCFGILVHAINTTMRDIDVEVARLKRYTSSVDPFVVSEPRDPFFDTRYVLRTNRASLKLIIDTIKRYVWRAPSSVPYGTAPTRIYVDANIL
jgi:hypothetical protein